MDKNVILIKGSVPGNKGAILKIRNSVKSTKQQEGRENEMPKIDVYNIEGKKVSDIELNENVFGIKPNEKDVYKRQRRYNAKICR